MDVRVSKQAGARLRMRSTKSAKASSTATGVTSTTVVCTRQVQEMSFTVAIACPPASFTGNNISATVAEHMLGCAHKCKAALTVLEA
jgi:hypothetical protein